MVHFIRFFWKPSERVRAKILRKVKFPLDWDATELCTPELQNKYSKVKAKLREVEDKKLEQERERKKRKTQEDDLAEDKTENTATTASTTMDVDSSSSQQVDWNEYVDPDLKNDVGANVTGQYELCSVLTHVGRSADSGKEDMVALDGNDAIIASLTLHLYTGHYISWVKKGGNEWLKYDDDKVSIVKEEDIQKLDGGGDWPMAYIVLYRAKKLD